MSAEDGGYCAPLCMPCGHWVDQHDTQGCKASWVIGDQRHRCECELSPDDLHPTQSLLDGAW